METISTAGLRTTAHRARHDPRGHLAAAGVSVSFLSRLERGEVRTGPETIHAILASLDAPERSDGGPGLRKRAAMLRQIQSGFGHPRAGHAFDLGARGRVSVRRLTPEASDVIRAVLEQCD